LNYLNKKLKDIKNGEEDNGFDCISGLSINEKQFNSGGY
jgi:hypothetical protein